MKEHPAGPKRTIMNVRNTMTTVATRPAKLVKAILPSPDPRPQSDDSLLLKLPPELREHIWKCLLVRPRTKFRYTKSQFTPEHRNTYFRTLLALMLANHQVHREAFTVFLKHNHVVLYQMHTPKLPRAMRLDEHWFTPQPSPVRRLSLRGYDHFETPKFIASCPDLRYLSISKAAYERNLSQAYRMGKDAWVLQYRTNLARLLGRRDGRIRFEGNGTFYDIFELIGCSQPVDMYEVLELIEELAHRCRQVAYMTHSRAKLVGAEETVCAWIVRIGFEVGGIVTAELVRRVEEEDHDD